MPDLAFFEDEGINHLKPMIYTRPVFDLRVGILSLRHRIELDLARRADYVLARPEVLPLAKTDGNGLPHRSGPNNRNEPTLFVNGRLLAASRSLLGEWRALLQGSGQSHGEARVWMSGNAVAAAWVPPTRPVSLEAGLPRFDGLDRVEVADIQFLERLWDLTSGVGRYIDDDASAMGIRGVSDDAVVSVHSVLAGNHFMAVGPRAVVEAGAMLLADDGPVIVEAGARVMAGAILRGPCHIGKGAHVRMGARVSAASAGEQCRVGGEISNSVLFAFANKSHDGYVGNSYIGAWCNIGADTNTSNLRNDYGDVTLYNEHLQEYEPSGQQFVGLVMGDHSRSGINTMFNTGTVVGLACNVFGAGYQPRHIPSFSWGGRERLMDHSPEKAFASIRAMMARRGQTLSPEEEAVLRDVYDRERGELRI
ncbi:MAG TPA: putative sugar nucleotidyl transferase, partial [Rhodothermia bacterium]